MLSFILLLLQYGIALSLRGGFGEVAPFGIVDLILMIIFTVQTFLVFGRLYFLVLGSKKQNIDKTTKEYEQIVLLDNGITITVILIFIINFIVYGAKLI